MTKRISGYQVTAVFFVPADPNDLQAMVDANDAISQFCADAQNRGFKALDIQQKFIQRREVLDEPTPVEVAFDVSAEFGKTMQEVGAPMVTKNLDDAIMKQSGLDIPAALDRRKST